MPKLGTNVLRWGSVLGGAYVLAAVGATSLQGRIIFPAPSLERVELDEVAARVGAVPVDLVSEDGTALYAWHRPATAPPTGRRAVLFFHGNAETVFSRVQTQDFLVDQGWEVYIVAYRGYPGSQGKPSEEGILMDAHAAWDWVTSEIPRERVVVHGKSLGGGVASGLAEAVGPEALVLESTFLSVPRVAADILPMFPTERLIWHRFETWQRAPDITCPVLIMHGDEDHTIRVHHGRELAGLFADATYIEIAGGDHNTNFPVSDPASRAAYLDLLERVAPAQEPDPPIEG